MLWGLLPSATYSKYQVLSNKSIRRCVLGEQDSIPGMANVANVFIISALNCQKDLRKKKTIRA